MLSWQPTASLEALKFRAEILAKIREFFAARNVLEVETPLLSSATVTDLYIQSFKTNYFEAPSSSTKSLYLQTSPEYAMKRLLAAGSGPIFQVCKAFRNEGEFGQFHNPEFTMLEWYRPGFNHHDLMKETAELLQQVLQIEKHEKISYQQLFMQYLDINPHTATLEHLEKTANKLNLETSHLKLTSPDDWLNLFLTHSIEPGLAKTEYPVFIYDFPATQAALARIRPGNPPVAERFEVYFKGVELANGFHELADAVEQEQRFHRDLEKRKNAGYFLPPIDQNFLAALKQGLPDCSGIALGIDRLVLLAGKFSKLSDILSFDISNS